MLSSGTLEMWSMFCFCRSGSEKEAEDELNKFSYTCPLPIFRQLIVWSLLYSGLNYESALGITSPHPQCGTEVADPYLIGPFCGQLISGSYLPAVLPGSGTPAHLDVADPSPLLTSKAEPAGWYLSPMAAWADCSSTIGLLAEVVTSVGVGKQKG